VHYASCLQASKRRSIPQDKGWEAGCQGSHWRGAYLALSAHFKSHVIFSLEIWLCIKIFEKSTISLEQILPSIFGLWMWALEYVCHGLGRHSDCSMGHSAVMYFPLQITFSLVAQKPMTNSAILHHHCFIAMLNPPLGWLPRQWISVPSYMIVFHWPSILDFSVCMCAPIISFWYLYPFFCEATITMVLP